MSTSKRRSLLVYFSLCFLLTWTIAGLGIVAPDLARSIFGPPGVTNVSFYLAVYVPSVVGIVLTAYYDGRAGLRTLFGRLDPRRGGLWALFTIVLFVAVAAIAAVLDAQFFGGPKPKWNWGATLQILAVGLLLDPGALGEEFGWRGFALPRMLARWSPLVASLVLGLLWGVWHLPAFLIPELPQSQFNFPLFVLSTVALTIVITWLWLKSKGCLLVAIAAHLMTNHVGDFTGVRLGAMQTTFVVAALLLVLTGQLARPRDWDDGRR